MSFLLLCGPNNISPQTIQMATKKTNKKKTFLSTGNTECRNKAAHLRSHIESVLEEISKGYFCRLKSGRKLYYISGVDEMKIKMLLFDKMVVKVIHVQKLEGQD